MWRGGREYLCLEEVVGDRGGVGIFFLRTYDDRRWMVR